MGALASIGPLSIDEASITKMTNAITAALATEFGKLIGTLNTKPQEGPAETSVTGKLDHTHNMNVSGSLNVEAPESLKNLSATVRTEVMKILKKQPGFNGADLASGAPPTSNSGGGTA